MENRLFQFIITSPGIAIPAVQKVITISAMSKGGATAGVINLIDKENPGANYNVNLVAELDPEVFLKNLSLTRPSTMELKMIEDKKPPKNEQLESFAKLLKENGYRVNKIKK